MPTSENGRGPHLSLNTSAGALAAGSLTSRERAVSSSAGAAHLAPTDLDELRIAIERSLCEGELRDTSEGTIDQELRKSLRVACAKARLQRVRAEHVLIDVKQIWMGIPSMITTHTSDRLDQIVTACIDEYYTKIVSPVL